MNMRKSLRSGPAKLAAVEDGEYRPKGSHSEAYKYVGHRMRELRKQHGLTQADVAEIVSVSPQQYQKYEDAQSKCSLTTLIKLAETYGVPLAALLPDDPQSPPEPQMPANDAQELSEADLLARLVGAFVKLNDTNEKKRLVQLVEAIETAHAKSE